MRVAVVGAGVAGIAASRALAGAGIDVVLIAPEAVAPLPFALVHAFAGRSVGTSIDWEAFGAARRWLEAAALRDPTVVRSVPMLRPIRKANSRLWRSVERNSAELVSYGLVAELLDESELARRFPRALADSCVSYAPAFSIDLPALLELWAATPGIGRMVDSVLAIEREHSRLRVSTSTGAVLVEQVVLCPGIAVQQWFPALDIERLDGAMIIAAAAEELDFSISGGGRHWAPVPRGGAVAIGATRAAANETKSDAAISLELFDRRLVDIEITEPVVWRGSRAVVPGDRLPIVGEVAVGVWLIGGLGSRGCFWAPWLAETCCAAMLDGARIPAEVAASRCAGDFASPWITGN